MNLFKKIGLINSIFILISLSVCFIVVIPTFNGQFNAVYSGECINKLELYSSLTADNIEKKCSYDGIIDFSDACGQIVSLTSKIDEPLSYSMYRIEGAEFLKVVENDSLKDDIPTYLPYADYIFENNTSVYFTPEENRETIHRISYTADTGNDYKPGRYVCATPIFQNGDIAGIVEMSMLSSDFKALSHKITAVVCIVYAAILIVTLISVMQLYMKQNKRGQHE